MAGGIRLLIVDDQAVIREGLRLTFEGTDISVVAEAADGRVAFELLSQHSVDVALVDVRMPRADGFDFLQSVSDAGMNLPVVLMHTIDEGTKTANRCRELGARGLILKGQDREDLLQAIRAVHAGRHLWSSGGTTTVPVGRK
ncbi:MAG TPA: response regulator transcription factor [Planctomycetaceae bacterium]|nr:response regulator transcription factor [Planctomycetaceae bacterium]